MLMDTSDETLASAAAAGDRAAFAELVRCHYDRIFGLARSRRYSTLFNNSGGNAPRWLDRA